MKPKSRTQIHTMGPSMYISVKLIWKFNIKNNLYDKSSIEFI